MKKISICLIVALMANLFGALWVTSAEEGNAPTIEEVLSGGYGAYFLLQDNEGVNPVYTQNWTTTADVEQGSPNQLGAKACEIAYSSNLALRSYFLKDKVMVNDQGQADFTPYQYVSFWYKGDGTATTLKLTFKISSGNTNVLQFDTPQLAQGDTDWHFYSADFTSGRLNPSKEMDTVNQVYLNVDAACTVQIDNLLLTEKDPAGGTGGTPTTPPDPGETTKPTTEPTTDPTTEPTTDPTTEPTADPTAVPEIPYMDAVKKGAYLLEDNEDGGNAFISWRGDGTKFETSRQDFTEAVDARLGAKYRKLLGGGDAYVRNYFLKPGGTSSETATLDFSAYQYFSFWYNGDGKANKITLAFKDPSGNNTTASVVVTVPAEKGWQFVSYPLAEIGGTGEKLKSVAGLNINLETKTNAVFVDNLMLSALDPTKPGTPAEYEITELSFGQGNSNGALGAGTYTVTGNIVNRTHENKNGVLVLAAYDNADPPQLTAAVVAGVEAAASDSTPFSQAITLMGEGPYTVRVLMWKDLESIIPLTEMAQ